LGLVKEKKKTSLPKEPLIRRRTCCASTMRKRKNLGGKKLRAAWKGSRPERRIQNPGEKKREPVWSSVLRLFTLSSCGGGKHPQRGHREEYLPSRREGKGRSRVGVTSPLLKKGRTSFSLEGWDWSTS